MESPLLEVYTSRLRCLSKRYSVAQPEDMGLKRESLGDVLWPVSAGQVRLSLYSLLALISMNIFQSMPQGEAKILPNLLSLDSVWQSYLLKPPASK